MPSYSDTHGDPTSRWHHQPVHLFRPNQTYIVTAATLHKERFFRGDDRTALLHDMLLELAGKYGWSLQAWAVFSNHYHWIGVAPEDAASLKKFVNHLHSATAIAVNKLDNTPGRKIWFEYWDTCLSYENSYYPRLKYVHHNPVHHGLVEVAGNYPYCSARWFVMNAEASFKSKVESYDCSRLNIQDDY